MPQPHPNHRVFVASAGVPWERALFDALADICEVVNLQPKTSLSGWLSTGGGGKPCLLPKGAFSHRPWLARLVAPLAERTLLQSYGAADALILTLPHHWPLAVHYPNLARLTAYHVSDDYAAYDAPFQRLRLEQEAVIVRQCDLVFAVSRRLAEVISHRCDVALSKIHIVPNGIPASWIPPQLPSQPRALPEQVPEWFRPLIGIIGVISRRVDLAPIVAAHDALPDLHWLFVGGVRDEVEGLRRLRASHRCRFIDHLPYDQLQPYFASLDAAVLPLTHADINPSSSPVRFFSQLPTGQPILYLGSCSQLGELPRLSYYCADPEQLVATLSQLQQNGFRDDFHADRHDHARGCTWHHRAAIIADALSEALHRSAH